MKRAEKAYAVRRRSEIRNEKREASHAAVCDQVRRMKVDSRVEFACTMLRGVIENLLPITGEGQKTYTVILAMEDLQWHDFDKFRDVLVEYNVIAEEEERSVKDLYSRCTHYYTWMITADELIRVTKERDVSIDTLDPINAVHMWRIKLYDAANKSSD